MARQIQEPLEDGFKHAQEGLQVNMAAMLKDTNKIKAIIETGVLPLNGRAVQSALRMSCRLGDLPSVQYLVEKGCDVNAEDCSELSTPLLNCCFAGDVELLKYLIKHGVDLNYADQNGSYGLITHLTSCRTPSKAFVEELIKHGANIFVKDPGGKMAFYHAMSTSSEIMDLLIETSRQKRREEGHVDDPSDPDPPFLPDSVLYSLPNVQVVRLGPNPDDNSTQLEAALMKFLSEQKK